MLMDLRSGDTPRTFATDICIIGAGAAGISLASKLSEAGREVVLIEAGGLKVTPTEQQIVQGTSIGRPFVLDEGRFRVLGGTTSRWRGRCAALSKIDFERREWVPQSGWPISYEELQKYRRQTEDHCGFTRAWQPDDLIYRSRMQDTFPDELAAVQPFVWRFAPTGRAAYQNWATRFSEPLRKSPNVTVILHANVTALLSASSDNHVDEIEVRTLDGSAARVRARHYVLACGGVENARLALNFAEQTPALFARVQGSLGRYFMQHPKVTTARIKVADGMEIKLQRLINLFLQPSGTQYELGFALSEAAQHAHRLLNCSAHVRYEPGADTGWRHMKALFSRDQRDAPISRHVAAIARDPRRMLRNGWRRARGRPSLFPSPVATLVVELEQIPDRNSRIFLLPERDRAGLRRACADWRISELESHTALEFSKYVDALFRRTGWGSLMIDPHLENHGAIADDMLQESYHHIGATRMSERGEDGVVDSNCTVHGIDNLHMAGASVMPTGGHVNPTFTLVSLALRLADHLVQRG